MRLQKFLSMSGLVSRREAETCIAEGKVLVNGQVVTAMGIQIDPERDQVSFEGRPVFLETTMLYLMLNKPAGVVTTAKDQFNRKTVLDLIDVPQRVYPVGRLDYDTTGLLLLTNDGPLTHRLTHPSHQVEKTYEAWVAGTPEEASLKRLRDGVEIEDYRTAPAKVKRCETRQDQTLLEIKIHEGRNRQVRKMCQAIGHPVIALNRRAIGKLRLEALAPGQWRHLTPEEIAYLKEC